MVRVDQDMGGVIVEKSFLPDFFGCVRKDPRLARAVERLCSEEMETVSYCLWCEALLGEEDGATAALLETLVREAAYRFRFLGRLLLALGGDLSLRGQIRLQRRETGSDADPLPQSILYGCLLRMRRLGAAYRSVIEGSLAVKDGVVRSALSCLLEDFEEIEERLSGFFG